MHYKTKAKQKEYKAELNGIFDNREEPEQIDLKQFNDSKTCKDTNERKSWW